MARLRIQEIRKMKKEQLEKQLEELKKELTGLRVAQVTGGNPSKLSKINVVRKSIARVLTVMNQTRAASVRQFFHGKKFQPLDLRTKKTRAMRRALTFEQEHLMTLRQKKHEVKVPKFAVRPQ
ncbi:putative ribosomal protein L35 [Paratrimastix pyriformis]|uniref:Ribosomal protein L35 n=1 Tax=Paratrimastix pyriformis TaxID=342808 RepID=A0ABQ8UV86_9EUKA|nr:putative ribosomal protein L35 [Paratrimastix pyriformis]